MHSNFPSTIHWFVKTIITWYTYVLLLMLRVYQSFNFDNLNSENQQSKFRPDMNTHQKQFIVRAVLPRSMIQMNDLSSTQVIIVKQVKPNLY